MEASKSQSIIDGINYYKGVLLCSRPNESPSVNLTR